MDVLRELGFETCPITHYLKLLGIRDLSDNNLLERLQNVFACYKEKCNSKVSPDGLDVNALLLSVSCQIDIEPLRQLCYFIGRAATNVLFETCYLFVLLQPQCFYGINSNVTLSYFNSYSQGRRLQIVSSSFTGNNGHKIVKASTSVALPANKDAGKKCKAYEANMFVSIKDVFYKSKMIEQWDINHVLNPKSLPHEYKLVESVLNQNVGSTSQDLSGFSEASKNRLDALLKILHRNHKRLSYKKFLYYKAKNAVLSLRRHVLVNFKSRRLGQPFTNKAIYQFLCSLLLKVVPLELFGIVQNRKMFFKTVKRFCKLSPQHSISMRMIMYKQKISSVTWLKNVQDFNLKTSLFAKVLLWLFKEYILMVVKMLFYVTEKNGKIYFYWKRRFKDLADTYLRNSKALKRIGEMEAISPEKNSFGLRNLRFIPKSNGILRPIQLNRKNRVAKEDSLRALKLLRQINLKFKMAKMSQYLDNVWPSVWQHWQDNSRPPMYFVHTDIMDAFGSVNHRRMLSILKEVQNYVLSKGERLCYREYKCLKKGRNGIAVKWYHQFDILPLIVPNNCVLLDTGNCKFVDGGSLFNLIIRYIESQVLCWQSQYYYVSEGIPQGGTLSSELCDLYYNSMDCRYLSNLVKPEDTLLRFVDDYLYITPSPERAEKFLKKMKNGFPDYKCVTDKNKTKTNLSCSYVPSASKYVTFCGTVIDTKNMSLCGNYSVYKNVDVAHTLKLCNIKNPGKFLISQKRVLTALMIKPIYINEQFNSKFIVLRNVFWAALLSAFRFHAIIRVLFMDMSVVNQKFLIKAVVSFAHTLERRVVKMSQSGSVLTHQVVRWLMFRAYQIKLNRHSTKYGYLLRGIRHLLRRTSDDLEPSVLKLLKSVTKKPLSGVFGTMI